MNTEYNYTDKWLRSPNGVLLGVCAGLAHKIDVEVWIVRLVWVLSILFFGSGIVLYFLAAMSAPRADKEELAHKKKLLGACYKTSEKMGWDIGLVRFASLLLLLTSFGGTLLFYIALAIFLPEPNRSPNSSSVNGSPT